MDIGLAKHSAIFYKDKIYLFGGMERNAYPLNTILIYDIANNAWIKKHFIRGDLPPRMYDHAAVKIEKDKILSMIIFGGVGNSKGSIYSLTLYNGKSNSGVL